MFDIAAAWTNACAVELKVCRERSWQRGGRQLNMAARRRRQDAFAKDFPSRRGDAETRKVFKV